MFVTHMFGCFFFGVAIAEVKNGNQNSWLLNSPYAAPNMIIDYPLWDKYGMSLYWALTTVSTVGFGDITPRNADETALAMFTMCTNEIYGSGCWYDICV